MSNGTYTNSDVYNGSVTTTLGDGTTYNGEWIDITYASEFILKRVLIEANDIVENQEK